MHTYIHTHTSVCVCVCVHIQTHTQSYVQSLCTYDKARLFIMGTLKEPRRKEKKRKTYSVKNDVFTDVIINIRFDNCNFIEDVFTA